MADVSKLDAMLNTLRTNPAAKRARRKGVELQVFVDAQGRYTITANGKRWSTAWNPGGSRHAAAL
jgi:hypothetical protein